MSKNNMNGEEFHRRVRLSPGERERVIQELHGSHYRELTGRFVSKGIPFEVAEGNANEVIFRLWEKCETLSGDTPPIHWMNRVASRLIADYYRDRRRRPPVDGSGAEADTGEDNPARPSEDDRSRSLMSCLTDIDPDDYLDPDEAGEDETDRRLLSMCASRALRAFEQSYPVESEWLAAYASGEMTIDELQQELECPSNGAVRERVSQWRKKLARFCLEFCETPDCSSHSVEGKK